MAPENQSVIRSVALFGVSALFTCSCQSHCLYGSQVDVFRMATGERANERSAWRGDVEVADGD